jgi:nucleoside-diphosphate-sugar epimerase
MINQHLGKQIKPAYHDPRPGDVKHSLASVEAARVAIGYVPQVMFAEGLARAIDYYRSIASIPC